MLEYNCISVETCWWPGRGLRRRCRRRLSRGCWWNGTSWSDSGRGCLWLEPPTFANMGCHPSTSLSCRCMEFKKGNFQTNILGNYGSLGHLLRAWRSIQILFKVILTWGWGWQWPRSWRLSACWWWWATHLRRRRFTWGGTLQNSMISWVRCVVRLTCFYGCRCYKSAYHKFSLDFCLLFGNYVGLSRHGVESIHFVEIWLDLTELYSTT